MQKDFTKNKTRKYIFNKKIELEIPRHSQGVMVAYEVCSKGIGAYKQALDYYKEDLINLSGEKA